MIVYFSGTGNSRYVAQWLAAALGDSLCDAGEYIKHKKTAQLHSDKPWVFVAPTYAWRLPRLFVYFLETAQFSGSKDAYFLMTCGQSIGGAMAYNRTLCQRLQLHHMGTAAIVYPENYIAMFNTPSPAQARRIRAKAEPDIQLAISRIRDGRPLPVPESKWSGKLASTLGNRLFYNLMIKSSRFYTTNSCSGCGLCVENCPLNNIMLTNGRPEWGKRCTHCMACICNCPAEAIEYGRRTKDRHRYHCPEYQG